jgi:quinol-cytochrome oxidoreductase complex cytochrome b subunit
MKAFLAAVVAAILIAVGSAFALDWLDRSSANVYQTQQGNVRL